MLVRPLGRELYLRHLAGTAGLECPGVSDGTSRDRAGGGMARIDPEPGLRLGLHHALVQATRDMRYAHAISETADVLARLPQLAAPAPGEAEASGLGFFG